MRSSYLRGPTFHVDEQLQLAMFFSNDLRCCINAISTHNQIVIIFAAVLVFLSVDKEYLQGTSVLAQILGHRVFHGGSFHAVTQFFSHADLGFPRGLVPFTL